MAIRMEDPAEIQAFLDRAFPTMLGVVGTVEEDGAPHVVPVWYRYDGELFYIWTGEWRRWVQNLIRDPRVSFSVQEDKEPYSAVVVWGTAEVLTSDSEEVDAEIRRITERYIPADEVDEYISGWKRLRTIVTIKPEKVTAWGRGY